MKKYFLIFMLNSSVSLGFAQVLCGPKLTAMGLNSAVIADLWSVNGNPSGIANFKTPIFGISYLKYMTDTELSSQSFALLWPLKIGVLGLGVNAYGFSAYHEITTGITLSRSFGEKLALGMRINLHQLKIENYGSTVGFSVAIGARYQLNTQIGIGIYIDNPAAQQYKNSLVKLPIPQTLYLGTSYRASDKIIIATAISRSVKEQFKIGVGIDYHAFDLLSFRAGLTSPPFKHYAGFGLQYAHLTIDLALESDPILMSAPQIGINYAL